MALTKKKLETGNFYGFFEKVGKSQPSTAPKEQWRVKYHTIEAVLGVHGGVAAVWGAETSFIILCPTQYFIYLNYIKYF